MTSVVRSGFMSLRSKDSLGKIAAAARQTKNRLYIAIPRVSREDVYSLQVRLSTVYHQAATAAPHVDTLVLLGDVDPPLDASHFFGYPEEEEHAQALGLDLFHMSPDSGNNQFLPGAVVGEMKQYPDICMGGTFDRLHMGQKLLLSIAALSLEENGRLFCGIAGDALFTEKALRELIEPFGRRERAVHHFLRKIRRGVTFETAELTDGYGPSVHDPKFKAIALTVETMAGGEKCNALRQQKGMDPMDMVVVYLINSEGAISKELPHNQKLSSTGKRHEIMTQGLLDGGALMCKRTPTKAYSLGITGGLSTGKSTVTLLLTKNGAEVIDADEIRKTFSDASDFLKELQKRIAESKSDVVAVEYTGLVEEGCADFFDEVWVVVAPPNVAKTRLAEQHTTSESEAHEKVYAQRLSGPDRLRSAHVMLSNHKVGKDDLAQFIMGAWESLQDRLQLRLENLDAPLAKRWCDLTAGAEDASYWWRELRDRYCSPERAYHNFEHVEEMFDHFDALKHNLKRPGLVAYAIFFHDAIYDPQAKNPANEVASANLWRRFAASPERKLPQEDIDSVAMWIERTARHMDGPAEGDLAYFLDIDLGVLGRSRPHYFQYVEAISLEYHHVPYSKFVEARPQAMKSFLSKPEGPYFTQEMRERYGQQALLNIKTEIEAFEKEGKA